MLPPEIQSDIEKVARIATVPALLKLVANLTDMRVTMVARVTPNSWTACAAYDQMEFGLKVGTQLDVATTLCKEVCDNRETIVIRHASQDPFYRDHPTRKMYNIESYIAIPIYGKDGAVFGTLCAIDSKPAPLGESAVSTLTHFADLISAQIQLELTQVEVERLLVEERKIGQLREEFIAVLGHDLRTPLGSVTLTLDLIRELAAGHVPEDVFDGVKGSVGQMSQLVEHMVDFARTRMGGGIELKKNSIDDLSLIVKAVIDELARVHKGREILFVSGGPIPVAADAVRMRQVFSNLIGNALQHSPATSRVEVKIEQSKEGAHFSVTNQGEPLPEELKSTLFEPFLRARSKKRSEGLGLGLYIASEIAKAHQGRIQARSDEQGTCFTVILPV